ncbi:hypothetical protein EJ05DRAFT_512357 [Pseudovirgaria hyperparasitica]|uniref:Uncharacterized protein n=1 Tax=Pseudovirgaria hyperparasitica TaxID=470096 RepID=A0A6A6W442_9PEZI|nr:uncharacterized protein EJ05DRAFT_512357 [Pseudovirgaria hyperparasitica]KAF2756736.1 hypothetical protein EJ05DRAFT_512357 [Pseudovirgaria hyperparasitica]
MFGRSATEALRHATVFPFSIKFTLLALSQARNTCSPLPNTSSIHTKYVDRIHNLCYYAFQPLLPDIASGTKLSHIAPSYCALEDENQHDRIAETEQREAHAVRHLQYVMFRSHIVTMKLIIAAEDGKTIDLDLSKLKANDVVAELDRHSRTLARKDELAG